MRLLERTLRTVYIAPGLTRPEDLGGTVRLFSKDRNPVRASLIPDGGAEMERQPFGLTVRSRCRLLMPLDGEIVPGDGVSEKPEGEPEWLCISVECWSAHIAATLERRQWP